MRILLVEDEPSAANVLAKGLRENKYAVDIASDGEAALYQASVNEYDIIILDIMLPKLDGFEVCKTLRNNKLTTPILMLTARDSISDRVKGLDVGADDYLTKPFALVELLARVRALLRRTPVLRSEIIQIEDLVINTRAQTVIRGGSVIDLTAKEYSLLEFLAQHLDEVVDRNAISEHVWDEHFDPFSNLIEVYIQRLRKKIDGKAPKTLLIHTRRGKGYILSAKEGEQNDQLY